MLIKYIGSIVLISLAREYNYCITYCIKCSNLKLVNPKILLKQGYPAAMACCQVANPLQWQ